MTSVFLDIFAGDKTQYDASMASYQVTCDLLDKNATIYGLPDTPDLLDEEQRGILQDLHVLLAILPVYELDICSRNLPKPSCSALLNRFWPAVSVSI